MMKHIVAHVGKGIGVGVRNFLTFRILWIVTKVMVDNVLYEVEHNINTLDTYICGMCEVWI